MIRKILPAITVLSFCAILVFMNISTPSAAGPFGILAIFVLAYIFFLGVSSYILWIISHLVSRISIVIRTKRPLEPLELRRSCYFSTVIAMAPIMLIGLQSVGANGVYSFSLVVLFVLIGCLYVSKTT